MTLSSKSLTRAAATLGLTMSLVLPSVALAQPDSLTAKDLGVDAVQSSIKLGSGDVRQTAARIINVALGLLAGAQLPSLNKLFSISLAGFFGYGLSISLFVLALRFIGTARTSAYFSTAPFIGAVFSMILFHETPTASFVLAGVLMAIGVWLHLREHHEHEHCHEPLEHEHPHIHDEHHQHVHSPKDPSGEPHIHVHRHEELVHNHLHNPDIHHQHLHKRAVETALMEGKF